jgi:hypothetical protein
MLAGVGVVDEGIALGAVDELEVLCARLTEYGFWGHGGRKQKFELEYIVTP